MKIFLSTLLIAIGINFSSQAQEISDNAIGLRFSTYMSIGGEISYQKKISDNNRLEVDLILRYRLFYNDYANFNDINDLTYYSNYIGVLGLYQRIFPINNGLYWYAGGGAGIGIEAYNEALYADKKNFTKLNIAGNIGIEYNFNFPLQVSLDIRPQYDILAEDNGFNYFELISLAARYKL